MAINKKLIHFKTKENFISANGVDNNIDTPTSGSETAGNAEYGQIKGTSIVFVKDSKEIWTHGNLYKSVNWTVLKSKFIKKANVVAGDLCVVDGSGNKKFIRLSDEITAETVTELGVIPIGVVVIPTSHDVYGTGECAIMSLNRMSYSTPDVGCSNASYETIRWGAYPVDTSLPNLNVVSSIGSATAQTESVTFKNSAYLPSDSFSGGATCVKDENACYYSTNTTSCAPSPYLTDGSRNPQYYDTTGSANNALADFDGIGNTNVLLSLTKSQTDWQTADTITNSSSSGYTPAACCCWRYNTVGTSQGDWYLPALGEFGYVCARRDAINAALRYIRDNQLVEFCSIVALGTFWSSSEYDVDVARYVNMQYCSMGNSSTKSNNFDVRAFCRV